MKHRQFQSRAEPFADETSHSLLLEKTQSTAEDKTRRTSLTLLSHQQSGNGEFRLIAQEREEQRTYIDWLGRKQRHHTVHCTVELSIGNESARCSMPSTEIGLAMHFDIFSFLLVRRRRRRLDDETKKQCLLRDIDPRHLRFQA